MIIHYKITFLDFWHLSSGLSGGARLDSGVIKDSEGFPFVPAKTLKGVLREVASGFCSKDFVNECLGEVIQKDRVPKAGACHFSNANLSEATKSEIKNPKIPNHKTGNLAQFLYAKIASTAIDEILGSAKNGSLREIEVVKPISLYGEIHNVPERHIDTMKLALKSLKSMGLNRNRGLGRLKIDIENITKEGNK